jgi:hypothetical protein
MNASGMVATRGWSGPCENFATVVGNNRHAVSSFDFINVIPSDRVFIDGVRNGYAFVEDRDFGPVNNEVNNATKAGRPGKSNETAFRRTAEPILNIQSGYQGQHDASADGAGFGAEDFGIAHTAIFAQVGGVNV